MTTTLAQHSQHLYQILCIPDFSSIETVRAAYKMMALRCHPDKNLDDPNSADKFREVRTAYEVLSNEERKKTYDTELRNFKSTATLQGTANGKGGHRGHRSRGDAAKMNSSARENPYMSGQGFDFDMNSGIHEELHRYHASRAFFAHSRANSSNHRGYKADPETSNYTKAQQAMFRRRERERQAELKNQLERERKERREKEREQRRREQERREEQLQRQWCQQQKAFGAGSSLRRHHGTAPPPVTVPASRGCTPHQEPPEAVRVTTPRSGLRRPASAAGSLRRGHARPTMDASRAAADASQAAAGVSGPTSDVSQSTSDVSRPTLDVSRATATMNAAMAAATTGVGTATPRSTSVPSAPRVRRAGSGKREGRPSERSSRAERLGRLREQQAKLQEEREAEARANPAAFFAAQLRMTVADERDERGQLIEKEEALEWGCLLRRSRAALEELFYGRYVRRIIQEEAIRREILFLRVREEHAVLVCTSKELRGRQSVEMLERKARKLLAGREASALYYVIRNSKAMKVLLSQEVTERRRLQELEQFRSLYLFNIFFPEMFERIRLRDFESHLRRKIIQGARDSALNLSMSRKVVVADSRARLPPRECVNSCSDSHLLSTSDTTTSTGGASPHLHSSAVLNMVATVKSAVANGLLVGSRVNSGGGVASPLSNTSPTLLEAKPRSQLLAVEQRARADLEEICDAEFLRIIRLRANTIHNCYRKQIQTVAQRAMQSSQDELCALRKHIALLEARLKEPVSGAPPESLQSF